MLKSPRLTQRENVQIQSFSGPYFPVFGLNTKIYGITLRIQSEYRRIRTRKNSVFGHFSCSASTTDDNSNTLNATRPISGTHDFELFSH